MSPNIVLNAHVTSRIMNTPDSKSTNLNLFDTYVHLNSCSCGLQPRQARDVPAPVARRRNGPQDHSYMPLGLGATDYEHGTGRGRGDMDRGPDSD